ncbi:MAG TPA: ATPase domain-containing protein [Candidatus Paceibacterota bacterium]|nr:ATPase domain-containing protein [Candidatus Paceibacterota bacterium]
MAKKTEKKKEKEDVDRLSELNKKHKSSISKFQDNSSSKIEYISTGIEELDASLGGGWPRGRIVEIYGPEGSGKTWMLSKAFGPALAAGQKCLLYDAEGSYHQSFAKMNNVDASELEYSTEDACEKIMNQIEGLCEDNEYDIIAIDSLASLVPKRVLEDEMGKQNISPLAASIGRCLPRVNSKLKKSKTVLIIINQLRDKIGAFFGNPESTPGGRTVKFLASLRMEVRASKPKKTEKPEFFEGDVRIAHDLNIRTAKNKVGNPFGRCTVELWYKMDRLVILKIKEAMENDVIERQKTKAGELRGRELKFRGSTFSPEIKYDASATLNWLRSENLLCELLVDMGVEDFDEVLEDGDLTDSEVGAYLEKVEKMAQKMVQKNLDKKD